MRLPTLGILDISKKKELWKEFAEFSTGKLKILYTKSREYVTLKLELSHKEIPIVFTESDTKPLKISIEIWDVKNSSSFILSRKGGFIDNLMNSFIKNKVFVNSRAFNKAFILTCEDKNFAKLMFDDESMQRLVLSKEVQSISATLENDHQFSIDITANRFVNDIETLTRLKELAFRFVDKIFKWC